MAAYYIHRREKCPVCQSAIKPEGIKPHENLQFPLLPVCVDSPREKDEFAPFTITICGNCGLILLLDVADPEVLYRIFHSDGIGKVWEEHYGVFASLISKHHQGGKLLEIGAGQGKLMAKLLHIYESGMEVIDPQYEGPRGGVTAHPCLLNREFAEKNAGRFSSVASSHTLEHFIDFNDYFENAHRLLRSKGLLFTSVPNQEANFAKGYGNQLNFEHPSVCTNAHWLHLHYKNGFAVRETVFFKDHSIMFAAERLEKPEKYDIDARGLSQSLLGQYERSISARIDSVRQKAKPDRENWVFGASNFTQPLFLYGLDEGIFSGVMDNSPLKHNKRLYGTSLTCRKPEQVISEKGGGRLRVFLNIGQYNDEVGQQLKKLSPGIALVEL